MRKNMWAIATLLCAVVFLASCTDSDNERARSVVEISRINEGGPVVLGMIDAGSDKVLGTPDDFVPAGHVLVSLRNRSYNQFITAPDLTPYGQFHVTRMRLQWTAADPSTPIAQLSPAFDYEAGMDVTVPKDAEITFSILLSSFYMKSQPFFGGLIDGSTAPFVAVANVTFFGHDSGSGDEIEIRGSAICEFIGVVVSTD